MWNTLFRAVVLVAALCIILVTFSLYRIAHSVGNASDEASVEFLKNNQFAPTSTAP